MILSAGLGHQDLPSPAASFSAGPDKCGLHSRLGGDVRGQPRPGS